MDAHSRDLTVVEERGQDSSAITNKKTVMFSARELSQNMWEHHRTQGPGATRKNVYLRKSNLTTAKFQTFSMSIVTS